MTPAQFLARVKRNEIPPVCLFLGQEAYNLRRCRDALKVVFPGEPEQLDATEVPLGAILDDARTLSLFTPERLIFVINADAVMPRANRIAIEEAEEDGNTGSAGIADALKSYVKDPTPGVTLVFEATRWDFEGDDKAKNERARKFYGAVSDVVEFRRFGPDEAQMEAQRLARSMNVEIEPAALANLVEALAADMGRIAVELEKLGLYGKPITAEELPLLVPDARQSTIFALVNALGRRDRGRALEALDALIREGEYLPLALAFLATQFRMALAAREAGVRSAAQAQSHFQKAGLPVWGTRAEHIWQTASKFSKAQLERGLQLIFDADRDLRSARPDDRTVVENFVVKLCA